MKHLRKSVLLSLLVLLISGCWGTHEIDQLALVSALGVDYVDGEYLVTLQIVKPELMLEDGKGDLTETLYSSGSSIFDAIRNSLTYSSKRIYLGYLQVIVFGRDTLEAGLPCLTDFFIRDIEIRPIVWIAVTKDTARDLLKAKPFLDAITGEGLNSLFRTQDDLAKCIHNTIREIIVCLGNEGRDFCCTLLGTTKVEQNEYLDIKGTALFHKETFAGYIDTLTSRGLLWLLGEVKGGVCVLKNDLIEETTVKITNNSTKTKVFVDRGKVSYHITINVEGNIGEQAKRLDPTTPEVWIDYATSFANHVREEAKEALESIRDLGSDPVGFGRLLKAYHPAIFYAKRANWLEFYRNVPIKISVNSKIKSYGMLLTNVSIHGD